MGWSVIATSLSGADSAGRAKKKPTKRGLVGFNHANADVGRQQPSGSPTHERHHQVQAWAVTTVGWAKEWVIAGAMLQGERAWSQ
jgi:hypothetical protein